MCICVCMRLHVCMCVCMGEKGREGGWWLAGGGGGGGVDGRIKNQITNLELHPDSSKNEGS